MTQIQAKSKQQERKPQASPNFRYVFELRGREKSRRPSGWLRRVELRQEEGSSISLYVSYRTRESETIPAAPFFEGSEPQAQGLPMIRILQHDLGCEC